MDKVLIHDAKKSVVAMETARWPSWKWRWFSEQIQDCSSCLWVIAWMKQINTALHFHWEFKSSTSCENLSSVSSLSNAISASGTPLSVCRICCLLVSIFKMSFHKIIRMKHVANPGMGSVQRRPIGKTWIGFEKHGVEEWFGTSTAVPSILVTRPWVLLSCSEFSCKPSEMS